jgi:AAHS family 4-hydroxybenzoate transporter-like MFS transporter
MNRPAGPRARLDLGELIDTRPVGATQVVLFALCALSLIMDGFDVQALGYVAPAIVQEWGIPSAALGPVFGAGNLGVLVGSLLLSVVADRVGRRPVLIGGTLLFAVMTLARAPSRSSWGYALWRASGWAASFPRRRPSSGSTAPVGCASCS